MNSNDSESGAESSASSGPQEENNSIITKILGEMKSEFNKNEKKSENSDEEEAANELVKEEDGPHEAGEVNGDGALEAKPVETKSKPRIVLLFKKPTAEAAAKPRPEVQAGRRSLRHKGGLQQEEKDDETTLKRSARRRSKDYGESVLQSAIARKEKSYNESNKPQRLTRQLKPTQKILENLALAKQEKSKSSTTPSGGKSRRSNDSDSGNTESETERRVKKHKHKHSKHGKKSKRLKKSLEDSGKESDSDQSMVEENGGEKEEAKCEVARRSRRISSSGSRVKDDSTLEIEENHIEIKDITPIEFEEPVENPIENDLVNSRLCLCSQKTQYFFTDSEDVTYCAAIDSMNEKTIGCSRVVKPDDSMLLRPSTRIPYAPFCNMHKARLVRHNCCPTCGRFCTQGLFVQCVNNHQYHRSCQISVGNRECCPHCGANTPEFDIQIWMKCAKKPIFLPIQKVNGISAKMSFQNRVKLEENKIIRPPLIPVDAFDLENDFIDNDEFDIQDLVFAIDNNDVNKVAAILASKSVDISSKIAEANNGTVLHLAACKGLIPLAHLLLISGLQTDALDKDQHTALVAAVLANRNEMVEYLIKAGASIEFRGPDGMAALHLAAKHDNLRACELLINAAVGIKNFINCLDDGGWTPLVWACEHGHVDIANFLIYKGADPKICDGEHNVALHWAAFSGSAKIAEMLVGKGCEVNSVNAHGDTPLHIGARQDMYDCVVVLLARGADVTLLNKNNESALDCVPPGGDSYNIIQVNITLQACGDYGCPNVILSNDISNGKESNPIQCYNSVDSDPKPSDFQYIIKNCITSDEIQIDSRINTLKACNCQERCTDSSCTCGKLSARCWYDEEGKLIPQFSFGDIPMIFECNDRCKCNVIMCNNRVVQKGTIHRFELFKTLGKGWGIRTLRTIPKGSFVCEYIGEIITDSEADAREDDRFLFDLENQHSKNSEETDSYCIDARNYGNFARFINHSCNPNLTSVKIFIDHQDMRFPRIGLFANSEIGTGDELSFDYGERFWIAKCKSFKCVCGEKECKYSSTAINDTFRNYQSRIEES